MKLIKRFTIYKEVSTFLKIKRELYALFKTYRGKKE